MKLSHAKIKQRRHQKANEPTVTPWDHPGGMNGYRADMGLPPLNNRPHNSDDVIVPWSDLLEKREPVSIRGGGTEMRYTRTVYELGPDGLVDCKQSAPSPSGPWTNIEDAQ